MERVGVCFLATLSVCGSEAVPQAEWPFPSELPNIGYLALGYNIYFGNPRATEVGADPGFQSYPIFQQVYRGHTTGDRKYQLPNGFTAVRNFGCALDFTSDATHEVSKYINDLDHYSKSGFRIPFIARFSGSKDYNDFYERMTISNERIVSSAAECVVYDAAVDVYDAPKLTSDFSVACSRLPKDYGSGEEFFDLFDNFGTHTLAKASMGSRYGFNAYFDEMSWTNVDSARVSVTHAASVFGFYHATRDTNTTIDVQVFQQNMDGYKEISLGAKPVAHGNAEAWADQVIKEPMPISYTLKTLCEIISDSSTKANCEKALEGSEYCSKRLQKQRHVVRSCTSVSSIECLWDGDCQKGVCVNRQCTSAAQSLVWRPSNGTLCLAIVNGRVTVEACDGEASNQRWILNSGEYQNYMQIQYASDTNLCMSANSLANGQPLTVTHCNGGPEQTWARDVGMGALYSPNGKSGNMCADAGSGVKAGTPLIVWQCNVLPQQQFDIRIAKHVEAPLVV